MRSNQRVTLAALAAVSAGFLHFGGTPLGFGRLPYRHDLPRKLRRVAYVEAHRPKAGAKLARMAREARLGLGHPR